MSCHLMHAIRTACGAWTTSSSAVAVCSVQPAILLRNRAWYMPAAQIQHFLASGHPGRKSAGLRLLTLCRRMRATRIE